MTAVTPTDRPKSVRNRCVNKVLVAFFMLSRCFLDFSVGEGAFVKGLSQISSLFSYMYLQVRLLKLFVENERLVKMLENEMFEMRILHVLPFFPPHLEIMHSVVINIWSGLFISLVLIKEWKFNISQQVKHKHD